MLLYINTMENYFFFLKRVYELSPFKKLNIFKEEEWFKEK